MKILITGAAGFVGGHLIEALKDNCKNEISAFVLNEKEAGRVNLPKENIYLVDITNASMVKDTVKEVRPDMVFHLAAQSSVGLSWKHPALTYSVNITGTVNILEALKEFSPNARILLVGSAEQYGSVAIDEQPIKETQHLVGNNPYSVSKMAQEAAARLFLKESNLQIIRVRAFNHIGAGQETKFVIPNWCSQVISMEKDLKKDSCLFVGNINVKRDFTDVRDIVRAYILLAENGKSGEIYNVGSGISHSLEDVLKLIKENSFRKDITWKVDESRLRPSDIEELCADVTKLKSTVDWEPVYTLEQSVKWIMEEMRKTWNS